MCIASNIYIESLIKLSKIRKKIVKVDTKILIWVCVLERDVGDIFLLFSVSHL